MKERNLRIDLVKLIATAMVVILHTIENAGGVHTAMFVSARYIWYPLVSCGKRLSNV